MASQETSCVEDKITIKVVVGIIDGADRGASVEICILVEVEAYVGVRSINFVLTLKLEPKMVCS